MMNAAPAPCTARAAIRAPIVGATAHTTDAAVNTKSPVTNMRLRPHRSPRTAATISIIARLRVYAFAVHWSWSIEACSSRRMVANAEATTSASSVTINAPSEVSARSHFSRAVVDSSSVAAATWSCDVAAMEASLPLMVELFTH